MKYTVLCLSDQDMQYAVAITRNRGRNWIIQFRVTGERVAGSGWFSGQRLDTSTLWGDLLASMTWAMQDRLGTSRVAIEERRGGARVATEQRGRRGVGHASTLPPSHTPQPPMSAFSFEQFALQLLTETLFFDPEQGTVGSVSLISNEDGRELYMAAYDPDEDLFIIE
ncbi:MAG: hypothetical protein AAGI08_09990, partial [Bacteroidota bacterium]